MNASYTRKQLALCESTLLTRPFLDPIPRASLIKVPRQLRSKEMVHAILDGAMHLIQREGVEHFTTNRVAEVAGVSVGSLYQYFASKEMILSGIIERGVLDVDLKVRDAVRSGADVEPAVLFRRLLTLLLVALEPYGDLLAEILSMTPVLSGTGIAAVLETRLSDALRDFLVMNSERYRLRGGPPALYTTVNGAIFVTLKWLAERPTFVSRDELVETFVEQIGWLLVEREV